MKEEKPKGKRGGKREGAGRPQTKSVAKPKTAEIKSPEEKPSISVKPKTRGVVIIAVGNSQYGKMAANLAASIRFSDKHTNIHLIHTNGSISHLTEQHKKLFTTMSVCPASCMTKNGTINYVMPKACIYELSPYDETLMIDADVLWFSSKRISELMQELSNTDFAAQSRGLFDYSIGKKEGKYTHWCDIDEAKKAYGLKGKFYQLSSELIWFRKNAETEKLFNKVKEVFVNPKIKPTVDFAGDMPDELAYNIASNLCGFEPRQPIDVFLYWYFMDSRTIPWSEVVEKYYGYSIGGNNIQQSTITRYSQLAKAHANALRLPYHFNIHPKSKWEQSRKAL